MNNKEKFLVKGVKRHFNGEEVLFEVESLHEHYDGIQIHEIDVIKVEKDDFVRASDVNIDNAIPKEVLELVEETPQSGMTYEEAEKLMDIGGFIALLEWGGFWFKNIKTGETLVLTKEGEITNTPFDEFKEREDWIQIVPSDEQLLKVADYFESLEREDPVNHIDVVVTEETLNANPELVDEGVLAGETIEANEEPAIENKAEELAPEPIAETPAPKKKKSTTKK